MFVRNKRKLAKSIRFISKILIEYNKYDSTCSGKGRYYSSSSHVCSYVHNLEFIDPDNFQRIPAYRVMDTEGNILEQVQDQKLNKETILQIYKKMILLNTMDTYMTNAQKRGQIPFYVTSFGEEATHFGSAAALKPTDLIFGTYRDAGVLMWRGFTLEQFMDQCHATRDDESKGKSMAVHYGCRALNFVPYSSPIATQMPQGSSLNLRCNITPKVVAAAGAAYAIKRSDKDRCVVSYFGEGSVSEGDAHAAFNFASTLNCPVIFFCRNNGFAISTTTSEQYKGDGIASKGPGYGMISIRVDGNDVFAVCNATLAAREICLQQQRPVLIEAMTYRVGDHSSADDSSAYRDQEEVEYWTQYNNPMIRLYCYMLRTGYWDKQMEQEWKCKAQTMNVYLRALSTMSGNSKQMNGGGHHAVVKYLGPRGIVPYPRYNDIKVNPGQ